MKMGERQEKEGNFQLQESYLLTSSLFSMSGSEKYQHSDLDLVMLIINICKYTIVSI